MAARRPAATTSIRRPARAETGTLVNQSPVTSANYQVTGLTNGRTYYFTVKAVSSSVIGITRVVNGDNEGQASCEVSATPLGAPEAPTRLAAAPGDGQVTLSWAKPASDGGSPVTGYNVYYATSPNFTGATEVRAGTGTALVVDRLVNGSTYYFRVTAVNRLDESGPSNAVKAVPVGAPVAPAGLAATPGDGQVTLSWDKPASDGGSAVTGYNVSYATSADFTGATQIHGGTGTAMTVTDLVNGSTYYFRVTAVNQFGESGPSDPVKAVPVGAPGAPAGLAATPGDGQVTLAWAEPASDGGSAVTGYNVSYATSPNFTGATVVHGGTGTGLLVNRLVNGSTYYFRVTAVNQLGESGPSNR